MKKIIAFFRRLFTAARSLAKRLWALVLPLFKQLRRSLRKIRLVWLSDFRRIAKSVTAIIIIFGLCVVPCLYAWFNIFSNWDPYGTAATSRVKISVFSEDAGASLMGVELNVGDQVVEGLEANDSIGWQFTETKEEALEMVYSGECYAGIIIPSTFSNDVLSFITLGFEHPQIQYVENEKKNAIASKITSKANTTVQNTVNSTFMETIAGVVATVFAVADANNLDFETLLTSAANEIRSISDSLQDVQDLISSTCNTLDNVSVLLYNSCVLGYDVQDTAFQVSKLATHLSNNADTVYSASENLHNGINNLNNEIPSEDKYKKVKELLKDYTKDGGVGSAVDGLYDTLRTGSANLSQGADDIALSAGDITYNMYKLIDSVNDLSSDLARANRLLASSREDFLDAADTLEALAGSEFLEELINSMTENNGEIAEYFASPIKMSTVIMYPIDNYGSAMAPFYTVLAQWVGALFCACLLKAEIRKKDIAFSLSTSERFWGRFGLFFFCCMVQALVTALGDLFYIGIYCMHPWLFVLGACVTGLCFCMINYALLFALEKIGLGASVIIMVIQVAGAGGSYPVDVVPAIFKKIYPFMPFNYAMNSLREAIAGTYANNYRNDILILLLMTFIFMALGLVLYKPAGILNKLINESAEKAEIMT